MIKDNQEEQWKFKVYSGSTGAGQRGEGIKAEKQERKRREEVLGSPFPADLAEARG